jgi:hypothetical protein
MSRGAGVYKPSGYSYVMRSLRYSINVTLDGCCDHRAVLQDEELHRHATENLDRADALLFGRVTCEMMEAAFRPPARTGAKPDWMDPFARTIDAAKKYVEHPGPGRLERGARARRSWSSARGRWRCGMSREGSEMGETVACAAPQNMRRQARSIHRGRSTGDRPKVFPASPGAASPGVCGVAPAASAAPVFGEGGAGVAYRPSGL